MLVLVLVLAGGYALLRVADARTFQFFGGLTDQVETSQKVVALTFDDGPDPAGVTPVLATLASRGVTATFFLIGRELEAQPELGRELAAAGHELGNHTYSHERMVLVTPGYVASEIERTDALIGRTGYRGKSPCARPTARSCSRSRATSTSTAGGRSCGTSSRTPTPTSTLRPP
ncbi:polysaccharide deacetylase family protein [Amycolatopsis sp. NPDC051373]|uniref:polysaccharide deacetylase family protein n=1 Tax=Amycolatopsis sp. NPDC051373 TaxID=3155801 RepID=UPI00344DDCEA